MSLVFAGIAPHSPITLPTIAHQPGREAATTMKALKELEGELYVMQPETIFVISPHAPVTKEAFSINLAPYFNAAFGEFGDKNTQLQFKSDSQSVSSIREHADKHGKVAVNVISQEILDYGTAVALFHLTQHKQQYAVVPISVSLLDSEAHFAFGCLLREVAMHSQKRIAIIASAELAHTLHSESGHGYQPDAETFDAKITEMIKTKKFDQILKLNPEIIERAKAMNGYRSLCVLFGALKNSDPQVNILSYESPYGVGLMVAEFTMV